MRKTQKKIVLFCIWAGYLLLNAILIYFHEPWRDEAQAWLIARDVPLFQLPGFMHYEGHPCLWQLLLAPLAKAGVPYFSMYLLSLALMTAAVGLFLFAAPVSIGLKALVVFSPICVYYYPVIARNYCMIPILVFLSAYWFRERQSKPFRYMIPIALMIQTHALMVIAAFFMCACFLVEILVDYHAGKDKRQLKNGILALALPVVSVILFGLQMLGADESSAFQTPQFTPLKLILELIRIFGYCIKELFGEIYVVDVLAVLALMILPCLLWWQTRSRELLTAIVVTGGTAAFHVVFYVLVYGGNTQKQLIVPLVMVWSLWILDGQLAGKLGRYLILDFCLLQAMLILHLGPKVADDVTKSYSGAKETGEWVAEHVPADAVILCDNKAYCTAVVPYLGRECYTDVVTGKATSYVTWVPGWDGHTNYEAMMALVESYEDSEVWLISCLWQSCIDNYDEISENYEVKFESTQPTIKDENFRVYCLKSNARD